MIEEMTELEVELLKENPNHFDIAGELADVWIVLNQLIIAYDRRLVKECIKIKLASLDERINAKEPPLKCCPKRVECICSYQGTRE